MRKKRVAIFANTNTLSHFTRALTIAEWLDSAGYESHIGISHARRFWASRYYPRCHKVLELWEPSGIPFPCIPWFSSPGYVEECIQSQETVIKELRPDLVISIFDFCSSISTGSIPHLSVNGYCMLPLYQGVLGFDDTPSDARTEQAKILETFWSYAARSFQLSMEKRGRPQVKKANALLVGDYNAMYEINDICCVTTIPERYEMIGPILWQGWEELGELPPWERDASVFTVYLNAGTLMKNERLMKQIIRECLSAGARILVSSGLNGPVETTDKIFCRPFLSPDKATLLSDIVICTGGTGACYTNLAHGIPSLVVPMQPEQATNGLHLQRALCGRVFNSNVVFIGNPRQFEQAIDIQRFSLLLYEMIDQARNNRFAGPLAEMQRKVRMCDTRSRICTCVKGLL